MNNLQELGSVFYRARMELNLSIEELEQQTKIRSRFLRAIEDGRFDEIPGEVYLKGFLRSYARAVDLDPEQVLIQYYQLAGGAEAPVKNQPPPKPTADESVPVRARPSLRQRRARQRRRQRVIAAVALVVLVAAGAALFFWNDLSIF